MDPLRQDSVKIIGFCFVYCIGKLTSLILNLYYFHCIPFRLKLNCPHNELHKVLFNFGFVHVSGYVARVGMAYKNKVQI